MQSFTEGYVTEFPYIYGYYNELNPLRAIFPLLRAGIACPDIKYACELGFGQGLSINIHAAASDIEWWGTDFNPSQVGFARMLGKESDAKIRLFDEPFTKFCRRDDLPTFDFIGLHGIWSWINDENKAAIVDLLKHKLAVGGILYISYNCYPGWAPMVPVRDLLKLHEEIASSGILKGIDKALDFAEKLEEIGALYLKSQPAIKTRLANIRKKNHTYLAHEYFNKDWDVMSFAKMAEWLRPAMLDYVCQANYLETIPVLNFTDEQINFLNSIDNAILKETARDFILNTQFRRDYWIKGKRTLPSFELRKELLSQKFILSSPVEKIELNLRHNRIEVNLSPEIYKPIINSFSDYKIHSLSEIGRMIHNENISLPQFAEAITVLCGMNVLSPAKDANKHIFEHCQSINKIIENYARSSLDISFLASPVTGGGVQVGGFQQLFLLAIRDGYKSPQDWAQFAWEQLSAANQKIIKEGKTLETPEDNLTELKRLAIEFSTEKLPILEKLRIR